MPKPRCSFIAVNRSRCPFLQADAADGAPATAPGTDGGMLVMSIRHNAAARFPACRLHAGFTALPVHREVIAA